MGNAESLLLFVILILFGLVNVLDCLQIEIFILLSIHALFNFGVLVLVLNCGDVEALACNHGHVVARERVFISSQVSICLLFTPICSDLNRILVLCRTIKIVILLSLWLVLQILILFIGLEAGIFLLEHAVFLLIRL